MKRILINNELWGYAKGSIKKPTNADKVSAWTTKDEAQAQIILRINPNQSVHVKN